VTIAHPEVGAVGSKIYYYDKPDTIWCTGGSFGSWQGVPTQLRQNEVDVKYIEEPYLVDYASGCAMLITRKAFEDVGYLDGDYFLYFEETDWCKRAKQKGFYTMIAPQSHVWHKVGFSSGAVNSPLHTYYMVRNNYAFLSKNNPGVKRYLILLIFVCVIVRRYILKTIGKFNFKPMLQAVSQGLWDAISRKSGKAPDKIQVHNP
jgi:GT2 family glycosyltransferase